MRLYVSGNNLATFTKYKGLDPEIQRGDPLHHKEWTIEINIQLRHLLL